MAKIKLTKNELKKQKDQLKRFKRYLPTLILKKQQLQLEIRMVEQKMEQRLKEQEAMKKALDSWVVLFGEARPLEDLVVLSRVDKGWGNIAGVDIPVFMGAEYKTVRYDLVLEPLWVDAAVDRLKEIVAVDLEVEVLREQVELLAQELRTTSQRVNLFEKVKIPEAKENIRNINIYLGDQQTAAVVRGKIAKSNLLRGESA